MYRDALPTMIERWRSLNVEVREKLALVGRRGWRSLPKETDVVLDTLRGLGANAPASLDEAMTSMDALERCRESLDDILATLDDPAAPWNLPDPAWPAVDFPWMRALDPALAAGLSADVGDEARRALGRRLHDIARRLDPKAETEPVFLPGARVRFRAAGAPMVLDAWSAAGSGFWSAARVEVGLLTTARRSAPRLVLHPADPGLGRSGRSAVTGDPELDERFVWEGELGATEVLRHPELQQGLRVVSLEDAPTLVVGEGLASLRWTFGPTARSVTAAVEVLLRVRDAQASSSGRSPR